MERLIAFKDGRFELRLVDGGVLSAPPRDDYEAWTIAGPWGLKVVSMPGGELAIWSPDQPDEA